MRRARSWAWRSRAPAGPPAARRPRAGLAAQGTPHAPAQMGKQLVLEPWILLEPAGIPPGRMQQGNIARTVVAPSLDRVRHGGFGGGAQMPGLGVPADQQ